jgi:uncharacterized protein YndB with AHSA1/START domain
MDGELGELGELSHVDGRWQLRFSRSLAHPPPKVWRAITEAEHLDAWFPSGIEGERVAGAKLRFPFREDEGPTLDGEMLVYDEPRVLEFRWSDDLLRFELEPDGAGTRLTFVNTFDELGKAARDAAGWHVCLALLQHHLGGEEPPWSPEDRWKPVNEAYVERFGPEAATIGPPGDQSAPGGSAAG